MPSSISFRDSDSQQSPGPAAALLFGNLAGPLAWLLSLELAYGWSYATCDPRANGFLHLVVFAPVLLVAAGIVAVRLARRHAGADAPTWHAWLQTTAYWSAAGFTMLIVATDAPVIGLLPCR
jgi:hypothetical protein